MKDLEIHGLESLIEAKENDMTFLNSSKYENISLKTELDFLKIEISDHQKILDENILLKKKLIEIKKNDSEIESEEIIETEG